MARESCVVVSRKYLTEVLAALETIPTNIEIEGQSINLIKTKTKTLIKGCKKKDWEI